MDNLLETAATYAQDYLRGIPRRSVAPSTCAIDRLSALGGALPDDASCPSETLALLHEVGSPATVASAGGRYFGFVIGGCLPVALAANWLADAWDQNAGYFVRSPVSARLEEISLRWLGDVLDLPAECAGAFVTGGTMANFTALAAARHAVLQRVGWDVERDGLFGAPPITVIVGTESHPTLRKALGMLGVGRDRVVTVPVDDQGRLRADALPPLDRQPTIICLQAGNANTGAFDPADAIIPRAHEAGAWVHVDGAFGLWAAAAPARRHLVHGLNAADSWATDAHKWLNVSYDSGLAFVRDAEALRGAMSVSAPYLAQDEVREPSFFTPETSRRARGVEVWAALRSLGRAGLADLIERTCHYATQFADGLRAAGYTVLNDVVLNQVLVSFGDAATTQRVIAALQADGTCWCGGRNWQGHEVMRISVSSWATTEEDVACSLAAMLRIAAQECRV
jgi:glutamate/tyrosine decarboxylase-like PLP-dependent enzyme